MLILDTVQKLSSSYLRSQSSHFPMVGLVRQFNEVNEEAPLKSKSEHTFGSEIIRQTPSGELHVNL